MKTDQQRRRLLVDLRYQLTQLGVALAANILVMLLVAVLMSWLYLLFFKGNLACSHNRLFPLYLMATALGVIVLSTLWSLRRSRTVAGMMRKLEYVLNDAAKGRFPDRALIFRKGDYFTGLAGPLNACLVRMKKQENRMETAIESLQGLQIVVREGKVDREEVSRRIDAVMAILKQDEDGGKEG